MFADQPDPEAIIDSVIDAYQEMYEELDVYDSGIEIPGIDSLARELDFVCLDLVSSASLLIFQPGTQTVLVMFQGEDRELEKTRPLLEAMTRSILCENA